RVEIYLVDEEGQLLAYFAEPEKIKRMSIDMEPVHTFLGDGELHLPLYGDDPRSPERRKPFSATPVKIGGTQSGYLYVILGGEQYDSVSSMLAGSYIAKTGASILGWAFVAAGLAGLLLFFFLTKRLRSVTATVSRFAEGDYQQRVQPGSDDEIGQLGRTFNQMADHLVESMAKMKMNDALRRELVANVSHDLRTPLASIQGYLETIFMKENEIDEERRQQFLDIIYQNTTMLNRLVGELFELSKLDAHQSEPDTEPFSLIELAQDTVLDFLPRAEKQGVFLEADFSPELPFAHGDIAMVERVLTNLVENALRHTPAGGRIRLAITSTGDALQCEVTDTGQGISTEDLPHIFDRFYRAEKGRSNKNSTGLGLAIAQKIIEAHGGQISATSTEGEGATFRFALPTTP
ncbi:MAG: signal transduction histidine kinase, partial [Candidatus Latescibacterota bacterium]